MMKEMKNDNRKCPWLGALPYTENDGDLFHGRSDEINEFAGLINRNVCTTLYGMSGTGKSSMLRAGLFPLLRKGNFLPIYLRLKIEANCSFQECLIKAIQRQLQKQNLVSETIPVVEMLKDENNLKYLWCWFARTLFKTAKGKELCPVIVLDQFEELLNDSVYCKKAEILLNQIYYMMDSSHALRDRIIEIDDKKYTYKYKENFRFIISIREDDLYLLEDCIDMNNLYDMKNCRYRLRPLDYKNAEEVISIPGKDVLPSDPAQKKDVIDKIIQLSTNKDDKSISTITLSIVCSMLYDDMLKANAKQLSLTNYMDESGELAKDNLFEKYYLEATEEAIINSTGKNSNELDLVREFIEDKLVMSERRVAIPKASAKDGGIKDRCLEQLLTSSKRILNETSDERIELIHDAFCPVLFKMKAQRELKKIQLLQQKELEEKDRLRIIESLYIAEKVNSLVCQGDSHKAQLLALEVLPKDLDFYDRPFVEEAADAFRKAVECKTYIIRPDIFVEKIYIDSDKHVVVALGPYDIRCWNINNGKKIYTQSVDKHSVSAFSNDGRIIGIAEGQLVRFYKLPNYIFLVEDKFIFQGEAEKMIFSADDKCVAILSKIWGIETPQVIVTVYSFVEKKAKLLGKYDVKDENLELSPQFNYIIKSNNSKVSLRNLDSNIVIEFCLSKSIRRILLDSEETHIVIVTTDSVLFNYIQTNEQKELVTFKDEIDVGPMTFVDSKKEFVIVVGKRIVLFDYAAKEIKYFDINEICSNGVFDKSASYIVSVLGGDIKIKETILNITKKTICEICEPWERFAAISLNQKVYACFKENGDMLVKKMDTGQVLFLIDNKDKISSVAFSSLGDLLLTLSVDGKIHLRNVQRQGLLLPQFDYIDENQHLASISLDNKHIVSISKEGVIKVWDVTSERIVTNSGVTDTCEDLISIMLSSDNKLVLLVYKNEIKIWDIDQKLSLMSWDKVVCWHKEKINCAIFSPDNRYIIVNWGNSGMINIISLKSQRVIEEIVLNTIRPKIIAEAMLFDDDKNLIVYTQFETYSCKLLQYLIESVQDRFNNIKLSYEDRAKYFFFKKTKKILESYSFYKRIQKSEGNVGKQNSLT